MGIFELISMFGGLALFLYGMTMLGSGSSGFRAAGWKAR
jgi:Na+/phosphate symporter